MKRQECKRKGLQIALSLTVYEDNLWLDEYHYFDKPTRRSYTVYSNTIQSIFYNEGNENGKSVH